MASAGGSTAKYASAPWALALCDRCGFSYRLNQLHQEFYDQRPNGLKVCRTCLDKDHPQLRLGLTKINDPQSLFNPRPDVDRQTSTSYFGWSPVGGLGIDIECEIGTVTVSVV